MYFQMWFLWRMKRMWFAIFLPHPRKEGCKPPPRQNKAGRRTLSGNTTSRLKTPKFHFSISSDLLPLKQNKFLNVGPRWNPNFQGTFLRGMIVGRTWVNSLEEEAWCGCGFLSSSFFSTRMSPSDLLAKIQMSKCSPAFV